MLLTLPWLLAVISGRVSIIDGHCTYKRPQDAPEDWEKLTPPNSWNLCTTGVAIGPVLKKNAQMMLLTGTTFLVIQVPAFYVDKFVKHESVKDQRKEANFEHIPAIIGLALCVIWFVVYTVKAVRGSSNENLRNEIVAKTVQGIKHGQITLRGLMASLHDDVLIALKDSCQNSLNTGLLRPGSKLLEEEVGHVKQVLACFFTMYDTSHDGKINLDECRMLMNDMKESLSEEKQKEILTQINKNASIDDIEMGFDDFVELIVLFQQSSFTTGNHQVKHVSNPHSYVKKEEKKEEEEEEEEDMPEDLADLSPAEQKKRLLQRAFFKLILGTVIVLLFTDPMCDMLTCIGNKLSINPFYVSFLVAPLASNASELLAAMRMASKKTKASMVGALSSLEGAAIMNNTFCLGIFMLLIVWKRLMWKFAAETLSILFVEVVVACFVLVPKNQTLLHACLIMLCYPACLLVVVGLEHFGLD